MTRLLTPKSSEIGKYEMLDSRRVPRPQDFSFGSTVMLFIKIVFLGEFLSPQIEEPQKKKWFTCFRSRRHKTKTVARNKIPTISGQGGFWSPVIEITCFRKQCYTSIVERVQTNRLSQLGIKNARGADSVECWTWLCCWHEDPAALYLRSRWDVQSQN